ncbi:MAG: hypothetical protein PHG06_12355 [Parabacteroides sp.]|nr:hypothetical protein [Parabacteroides sp.]
MEEIIFKDIDRSEIINNIKERRLKTEKQCSYIKGILAEAADPY